MLSKRPGFPRECLNQCKIALLSLTAAFNVAPGAGRKSCAITTAKRLAQFLGDERIKDKGLNCNYVIAKRPENQPTSERAIPVAIFSTEPSVARSFLRRWCGHLSSGAASQSPTVVQVRNSSLHACNMIIEYLACHAKHF